MRSPWMMAALALCLSSSSFDSPAWAASTIDPTQPPAGAPYSSTPIRNNFQAATNDITSLQKMNAGATAPAFPSLSSLWLETPSLATTYTQKIWDGTAWLAQGTVDTLTHRWTPFSAGAPLVSGPVSSTIGHIVSFGSTDGAVLVDTGPTVLNGTLSGLIGASATAAMINPVTRANEGGILTGATRSGYTAMQMTDWVFCNCVDPVSVDGVRGIGILTPGSTIDLVNGIAGYVMSQAPISGPFPTAVAVFGVGIADVNSSSIWGLNTVLSDNRGQVISSGTGKFLNNELDFNFTSPSSAGIGLVVQGASLAQPAFASGFSCGPLDLGNYTAGLPLVAKWSECLSTVDGAGVVGLSIGRTAKAAGTANLSSQILQIGYTTAGAVAHNVNFTANPAGGLAFQNTQGTPVTVSGIQLAALGASTFSPSTDHVLRIRGQMALSDGMSIYSTNTADNALKGLELNATILDLRGSAVNITGPVALSSTLGVAGATTLSTTLGVTGAATLSSTLGVTGAVTLNSTLSAGATIVNGTLTAAGHFLSSGTAATISSGFGTSPSIVGGSNAGRVTVGAGGSGGGVIAFDASFSVAPVCFAQDETTANSMRATPTTGQVTITGTMVAADKISYWCAGVI